MTTVQHLLAFDGQISAELSARLTELSIEQELEAPTKFRARFEVDICEDDIDLPARPELRPRPEDIEVTVLVDVNGVLECLAHGIITKRKLSLLHGGAGSWYEIEVEDKRVVMKRRVQPRSHTGLASDAVDGILRSHGFRTSVVSTPIEYSEEAGALNQTQSDLDFVVAMANEHGYQFWLDCELERGLTGQVRIIETAHFKPSPPRTRGAGAVSVLPTPLLLEPTTQLKLRINVQDDCVSMTRFEVEDDTEQTNTSAPIARVADDGDELDSGGLDGTVEDLLGSFHPPRNRAGSLVTAGDRRHAEVRAQAALDDAAWFVQARAEITAHALGGIVKPHDIIMVEGAGSIYAGPYFIYSVSHTVNGAEHKMQLRLRRNALGAPP